MTELKKCPFCGEEASHHHTSVYTRNNCLDGDWNTRPLESTLQSALTTAQEENKYLKTWIPEYLDNRLSPGEQTEIREFIRGKIDLNKLPQWLVNIVEENKRLREALEFYAKQENWSTGRFSEDMCKAEYDGGDIAQSALNGGK